VAFCWSISNGFLKFEIVGNVANHRTGSKKSNGHFSNSLAKLPIQISNPHLWMHISIDAKW
jgi:hypothetical protein